MDRRIPPDLGGRHSEAWLRRSIAQVRGGNWPMRDLTASRAPLDERPEINVTPRMQASSHRRAKPHQQQDAVPPGHFFGRVADPSANDKRIGIGQ